MGGKKLCFGALCALMLGFASAAEITIRDIKIEGIQRTDPGTVLNYLPLKKGISSRMHQPAMRSRRFTPLVF